MSTVGLFILLVTSLLVLGDSYFNSSCRAQSENASELCELATPSINFTAKGQRVDISVPTNESLWVGYVQDYAAFSYKGCVKSGDLSNPNFTSYIKGDPGHCFSYCKTNIFGMRITRTSNGELNYCYCIRDSLDGIDFNQSCSTFCDFPTGSLCGGTDLSVSVYKKVQYNEFNNSTLASDGPERQCLAYDPSEKYFWSSCNNTLRVLCRNGSELVYDDDNWNKNWAESQHSCLASSYVPVYSSETNLSSIPSNGAQLWIGTIRSLSIFNIRNVSNTENVQQGYISKSDNNMTLQFGTNNDIRLRGLCKGGDNSSICAVTTSTAQTTSVTTVSPPSKTTATAKIRRDKNGKQEGKNLAAVYVVIPLVLLIAAAVAAFLIWRRRRKAKDADEGTTEYQQTQPSRARTHNAVANAAYQDDHRINVSSKENPRHDYLVLEPHNEYSSIRDGDLENKDSGDYDTTNTLSLTEQHVGKETCNVYNRLQDVVDDPYNHTPTSSMNTEDTYNHTGNEESAYSTTDTLPQGRHGLARHESENNGANNFDDTYNHVNLANTSNDTYNHVEGTLSNIKLNSNVDDNYNHPGNKMIGAKQVAESYTYTKPLPTRPPPRPDDRKQTFGKAYATEDNPPGSN